MFESAKVTVDYKEFQLLVEAKKELALTVKRQDEIIESFEDNKYVQALDKIEKILVKACKPGVKVIEKSRLIHQALDVYCETFDIPKEELF